MNVKSFELNEKKVITKAKFRVSCATRFSFQNIFMEKSDIHQLKLKVNEKVRKLNDSFFFILCTNE